jgi:hypothetical protein
MDVYDLEKMVEIYLMYDVVIIGKFKALEFDNGISDPLRNFHECHSV